VSGSSDGGLGHLFALKLAGAIVGVWLVLMSVVLYHAALPPEGSGVVIAVFPPGTDSTTVATASAATGARILSTTWFDNMLVVEDESAGFAGRLKQAGAVAAFRNVSFAGLSFVGCVGGSLGE
jgi:hypothetical protein